MKIKIECCRNKKIKTVIADVDLTKKDIFNIAKNVRGNLDSLLNSDFFKNCELLEKDFGDDEAISLEHSFYDRIVRQDMYIGSFSYGEWKEDGSYYVGGFIFLFAIKDNEKYKYKFMHQRYYEDELDKYGSFAFIDGQTNYFTTNLKQKMRKKPMVMPIFSSDIWSLLDNIEEISSIKEIKEILDCYQE